MTVNPASARTMQRAAAAGATAASALLAACTGSPTQLHVEDSGRLVGSVRGVVRFGAAPGGSGLEFEASRARASGPQTLQATEVATLDGRSISGPATLRNEARVDRVQVAYNHLLFPGRPVELEWFAGAASVTTRWDTDSSLPSDPHLSSRTRWVGPTGGVLGRVRLAPGLSLEGRYAGAVRITGSVDSGSCYQIEGALAFRPGGGVVLRGGFAESRSWVRASFTESEQSVRARGPFVNLGFEF